MTQGGHFVTLDERTFATRDAFRTWLFGEEGRVNFGGEAQSHSSSPFVWIDDKHYLGGCDALLELAAELEGASAMEVTAEPRAELTMCIENFWTTLPKSGTYFTGAERVMIAHEVRAAKFGGNVLGRRPVKVLGGRAEDVTIQRLAKRASGKSGHVYGAGAQGDKHTGNFEV